MEPGRVLTRVLRVVVTVYFLEVGAFLTLSPWSRFWSERVVGRSPRRAAAALHSPFFRGFVTGLGLLHLAAALREVEAWRRGRDARARAEAP